MYEVKKQRNNKICEGEKGITLIALIITIIILLILAGVTINVLMGDNGLFKTTKKAGEEYEEAGAREKLEAVLIELQADKITKSEVYNEKEYIDSKLKENNMQVDGNIVIVDEWQFEIDRNVPKIVKELGKLNDKISDEKPDTNPDTNPDTKVNSIKEMLKVCNIEQDYTKEQILDNQDNILSIIFENELAINYIIENLLDDICNSEEAMIALGNSNLAYEKVMSNEEYFNKIVSSSHIDVFETNAKKVPQLESNSDKGFVLTGTEHSSYPLYNAFNEDGRSYWLTPSFGDATMYIEFPTESKIYHMYYYIGVDYRGNYQATTYEIYGIDNDGNEHHISTGDIRNFEKNVYFYNNTAYSKYKIFLTQGPQAAGASILGIYYR